MWLRFGPVVLACMAGCARSAATRAGSPRVATPPALARDSVRRVVTPDGATLAVTVVPPASADVTGPTVLVLHGGPGVAHGYLRPEWDRLRAVGPVVYYDQRGCGASSRTGPYTWEMHVRDLRAVLDSVAPRGPVVLAGSSWGALLALLFLATDQSPAAGRVAAVVLSGVPPWPGRPELRADERAALPDTLVYRDPAVDTVPVAQRAPRQVPLPRSAGAGTPRTFTACLGAAPSPRDLAAAPGLTALRAIRAPVLLIGGTDTLQLAPMLRDQGAAIAAALPRARRVLLPGAGHDPWLDQAGAFFDSARAFVGATGIGPGAHRTSEPSPATQPPNEALQLSSMHGRPGAPSTFIVRNLRPAVKARS